MRAFARGMGMPSLWGALTEFEHSLRTGSPAVETFAPQGFWAYLDEHPDEARVFGQAMTAKSTAEVAAVLDAFDFTPFATIADIGGGRGHLLRAVLAAEPTAEGVLFDLPGVIDGLPPSPERMTPRAGDFFVDPLPTADAYLLMEVLHDWADAEAVVILRAIRRAARPGATVLVIEGALDEERADPHARTLDVIMLTLTGGRERTVEELAALFEQAGFRLGGITETASPMRIVQATAI
jgi:C-methyltransferase